jgi:hypothetical protein
LVTQLTGDKMSNDEISEMEFENAKKIYLQIGALALTLSKTKAEAVIGLAMSYVALCDAVGINKTAVVGLIVELIENMEKIDDVFDSLEKGTKQ